MANDPLLGLEHAWRKLMRILGVTHRNDLTRNRVLIDYLATRRKQR